MPASCSGAMRTTFRGNPWPIPRLRIGIVWGGPGRCWRSNLQGLEPPDAIPRPPFDRMPAHRMAAGRHPGASSPKVAHAPSPQPKRWRNRAGHHASSVSHGKRASASRRPGTGPSKVPLCWEPRRPGPQEAKGPPHLLHRHAELVSASTRRPAPSVRMDPETSSG